jgi:peptide/nickel transport system substrate-binding protein
MLAGRLPTGEASMFASRSRFQSSVTRRGVLRMLAVGATVFTACGPASPPIVPATSAPTSSPPTSAPTSLPPTSAPTATAGVAANITPTPQPAPQAQSGGTLRVAVIAEPPNLDGFIQLAIIRDQLSLMFDKLIDIDQNGAAQPRLAESWEFTPDYQQLTLNLRQGVRFHSDREMTSSDVKWNIDRTHDATAGNGNLPPLFAFVQDVQTPDPRTVILHFDQAKPAAFDILNFMNVLDPQADAKQQPVGTGPFKFAEWSSGDHLRVVKNTNYWEEGKPSLDEIVFQFIKDPQAMVTALEAGTVDLVDPVPTTDAVRLRNDSKYQVLVSSNPSAISILGVNVISPPFDKKEVRQALNFALNRQRMVDVALSGFGEPRVLPWPATSVAYDAGKARTYTFDLDRAKTLLGEAGVSGFSTELTFPTNTPEYAQMGQIFQADLANIGITLSLKPLDAAAWNNYVVQTTMWGLSFAGAPPVNLHPSSVLNRVWTSPTSNINNFRDPAWTDLAARVAAEGDPTKLKALSLEVDDYLLDQCWFIPVASAPPKVAARGNLRGVAFDANDTPTLRTAALAAS